MGNKIPCPICGGNKFKTLLDTAIRNRYDVIIVACENCQFVFHNPIIDQQLLNEFFFLGYYKSKRVGSQIDHRFIRHSTRRAKSHIRIIKRFFRPDFRGKVLDVGCGAGFFLNEIRKFGWDVYGVEPDANCYEYAVNTLKIAVERCLFQEFKTNKTFDLIYFSHIFDDLPEINDILTKVRSLLNPKGEIFIEVPNYNSDSNFKRVQEGDFLENKLYFTPNSLSRLLEINNFYILYLRTKEPVYLNTIWQYLISPFRAFRKLIPSNKKSHIRVVATVK